MRLLLDTHVILSELHGETIGARAREAIRRASGAYLSVVSFVEVGIKASTGKLAVPQDMEARLERGGVQILGLTPEHGLRLAELPLHHRDPFDRLLISQARC